MSHCWLVAQLEIKPVNYYNTFTIPLFSEKFISRFGLIKNILPSSPDSTPSSNSGVPSRPFVLAGVIGIEDT